MIFQYVNVLFVKFVTYICGEKEVLITDITMLFPDDKNWFLNLDSLKNLTLTQGTLKKLLAKNVTSFDALCTTPRNADVFLSTERGALVWISCNEENISSRTLMASKNEEKKICGVKVIKIHGRYHLFYCLDSEMKFLVHQVVSGEEIFKPIVIDNISRNFVYDIVADEDSDIHIVYQIGEELRYRRYVYSEKRYVTPQTFLSARVRSLCIDVWEDRVFVLLSEKASGITQIFLVEVCENGFKKNVMHLSGDYNMCLNCGKGGIIVYISSEGMCYEIKSDYSLNVQKPMLFSKCSGVQRIRCANEVNSVKAFPVNRHKLPLETYRKFNKEDAVKSRAFAPKGVEIENFANRYAASFADKMTELRNEEILQRLSSIEKAIYKFSASFEKFLEETKENQSPSS